MTNILSTLIKFADELDDDSEYQQATEVDSLISTELNTSFQLGLVDYQKFINEKNTEQNITGDKVQVSDKVVTDIQDAYDTSTELLKSLYERNIKNSEVSEDFIKQRREQTHILYTLLQAISENNKQGIIQRDYAMPRSGYEYVSFETSTGGAVTIPINKNQLTRE